MASGDSSILIRRLELTRKQYYSRMSDLVNAGLIRRKNGKHFLTSFGKVVYEAQMLIGEGIQNYWKLKAIDSIESSSGNLQLPIEEYNRFVDSLIESNEIKYILLDHNNIFAVAQNERVYNSKELVVSAPTKTSSP